MCGRVRGRTYVGLCEVCLADTRVSVLPWLASRTWPHAALVFFRASSNVLCEARADEERGSRQPWPLLCLASHAPIAERAACAEQVALVEMDVCVVQCAGQDEVGHRGGDGLRGSAVVWRLRRCVLVAVCAVRCVACKAARCRCGGEKQWRAARRRRARRLSIAAAARRAAVPRAAQAGDAIAHDVEVRRASRSSRRSRARRMRTSIAAQRTWRARPSHRTHQEYVWHARGNTGGQGSIAAQARLLVRLDPRRDALPADVSLPSPPSNCTSSSSSSVSASTMLLLRHSQSK
jgi:hypothetical protein